MEIAARTLLACFWVTVVWCDRGHSRITYTAKRVVFLFLFFMSSGRFDRNENERHERSLLFWKTISLFFGASREKAYTYIARFSCGLYAVLYRRHVIIVPRSFVFNLNRFVIKPTVCIRSEKLADEGKRHCKAYIYICVCVCACVIIGFSSDFRITLYRTGLRAIR